MEIIVNYIPHDYEYGKDVAYALKNFQDYDFTPELLTVKEVASEAEQKVQEMILSQEVREYVSRQSKYRDNMSKAYALILGQCTTGLKNKLEARKDWEDMENKPIKLLKAIKEITHNYQDSRFPIASIFKAIKTVMKLSIFCIYRILSYIS